MQKVDRFYVAFTVRTDDWGDVGSLERFSETMQLHYNYQYFSLRNGYFIIHNLISIDNTLVLTHFYSLT